MTERILKLISDYERKSGKCGIPYVKFLEIKELKGNELNAILKGLHKKKLIKVKKGINGFLIFKNNTNGTRNNRAIHTKS
ncbi:hypothetical protein BWK60_07715 [Flavobacterium covae]|uniref:hypothetical protein n=1 Tax=Flavobacterium covae TaxID=2906076 RepID=UPI000B4D4236|nr:hypothetical protein [Flavobacterium covae]OWP86659.1 hypothetical protein BWK60_07715 [Flavobacterium covae]